jgi:uncharacterized membrane protein YphA (DoxX/SURF4 family)
MKTVIRIIQVIVGVLFIISGLVKANDPLGLSYKMQEFFELWNTGLHSGSFFMKGALISLFEWLHGHSLALSVIMITFEIITGVALLLGWKKRPVLWLLLLLIIFFTFLTGYAYLSGKFTNCGCFGDCLPITPLTSFLKDITLLIFIILLLTGQRFIQPVLTRRASNQTLVISLIISLLLQWYVLNYLPLADCLPFKRGNNIAQQMKPPPGSYPDSFAHVLVYEKGGKRYEFSMENLPADFETYTYIDRMDKLIRKGNADPPIKGFTLTNTAKSAADSSGSDSSAATADALSNVLAQPKAILLFTENFGHGGDWLPEFKEICGAAAKKGIPVYVAASDEVSVRSALNAAGITVPVFACDFTVIRMAARTSPTLYFWKRGTVYKKYSYRRFKTSLADLQSF